MRQHLEEQIYNLKEKKGEAEYRVKELEDQISIEKEEMSQKM